MRKYIVLVGLALVSGISSLLAQGPYLRTGASYAIGLGAQRGELNSLYNENGKTVVKSIALSYGKGLQAGLAGGYMFTEHIGAEIGLGYLWGAKTTTTSELAFSDQLEDPSLPKILSTMDYFARMLKIMPAVVFQAGFKPCDLYFRLGMTAGIGSLIEEFSLLETKKRTVSSGGIAWGMNGACGVQYAINEKLKAFAELSFESLSYAPTKSVLEESTSAGIDELPKMPTWQKETEFVDELKKWDIPERDKPRKELKSWHTFGNAGIGLGVSYCF